MSKKKLIVVGTFGFVLGLVGGIGYSGSLGTNANLLTQSITLSDITKDAMEYHAPWSAIVSRVRRELPYDDMEIKDRRGLIAIHPRTGFLGLGGRWLLVSSLDKAGNVERAWLEFQPVGWP